MRKFTALYTHQKQKKAKTWQDGFAHYNGESNDIVVYDSSNQRIASYRLRARETIEISSEYDIGRFLVTLEEEIDRDEGAAVATEESSEPTAAKDTQPTLSSLSRPLAKRAKRLPSLIKPIKLKNSTSDKTADGSAGASASVNSTGHSLPAEPKVSDSDNTKEYVILYTTQKVKKVKSWLDGTLIFYSDDNRISLKSEDGGTLTSTHLPRSKSIEVGGEIDIGMYLVQIEGVKGLEKDGGTGTGTGTWTGTGTGTGGNQPLAFGQQLSGALKRRYESVQSGGLLKSPLAALKKTALPKQKLQKTGSSTNDAETLSFVENNQSTEILGIDNVSSAAATTIGTARRVLPPSVPLLKRAPSSNLSIGSNGSNSGSAKSVSSTTGNAPVRAVFVPPAPQRIKYLHFPRRSELLQHVSVSKGYNMEPPRQLTASVEFAEWTQYQSAFSALLRENLMSELSSLAIRYFFMAMERHDGLKSRAASSGNTGGRGRGRGRGGWFGGKARIQSTTGLAQACKSVGVAYFEECTIKQPYLDGAAFRAQVTRGSVQFSKGDSLTLELSRREKFLGYAKDDTWAISTSSDFPTETTFLARSMFFGPSKNNTLELMIAGEEDAKAAMRIFGDTAPSKQGGLSFEKSAPTVVAMRCLDSASDWSMIDTVEEVLNPSTLPLLPHLLRITESCESEQPLVDITDANAILEEIEEIIQAKRRELSLNNEQFDVLEQVVMSAVSIYIPVDNAKPVTIVHGPFGTGKSFLIAVVTITLDTIASRFPTVFGHSSEDAENPYDNNDSDEEDDDEQGHAKGRKGDKKLPPMRVLLSSMTNFAVDNMLCALLKQGYEEFLRVGNRRLLETSPMWRKIIEYCGTDNLGISVAQAFINRVSETIVDSIESNDIVDDTLEFDNVDDCLFEQITSEICEDKVDMDVETDTELVDQNNESEDDRAALDEYGDDGIVGGTLSQWLPSSMDEAVFGVQNDDGEDFCGAAGDILDCLDVDLDEM
ncbi:hypothetical protein GGI07_005124 [Coemansia sp. Benny D115]|nr:hypothetical protein GGI07_005124 [Coemansia sp. Benny D115]